MNFKPMFREFTNLNDTYFTLLWELWNKGRSYKITEGSNKGHTRLEFDYCSGFINFPHERPLSPIMPPGIPPTTTDDKITLEYFPKYLMDPNLNDDEHYRYSCWLNGIEHYKEFNGKSETPIEWVIRHFKQKGYGNNHCYINIGNVDSNFWYDIPSKTEDERKTSPCFRGIDFAIKDGYLITSVIFRSWDLYAGFPENMGGFTLLNEYVANHLPIVSPGPLTFTCSKLHAYDYQIKPIATILQKDSEQWE